MIKPQIVVNDVLYLLVLGNNAKQNINYKK